MQILKFAEKQDLDPYIIDSQDSSIFKNESIVDHQHDEDIDKRGNPQACIFVARIDYPNALYHFFFFMISLNKQKTGEELNISVYNHFMQWGKLINVKVLKDWMERPYAFVQFERTSDADLALKQAPGTILDGRSIRCEAARVNRTLFLTSHFNDPLEKEEILRVLSVHGPIENVSVEYDVLATSAFVKFCYRDDAIKAYLSLQLSSIKRWSVEWASNLNSSPEVTFDKSCIYIGNLDKSITKVDIQDRFSHYGTIRNINIVKQENARYKTAFAFVKYTNYADATKAIEAENGQTWHKHILQVSYRETRKSNGIVLSTKRNDGLVSRSKDTFLGGSHTPFYRPQPYPPGLGIPAATSYMYGTHVSSPNMQHFNNINFTRSSAMMMTATGSPPLCQHQEQHFQHRDQDQQQQQHYQYPHLTDQTMYYASAAFAINSGLVPPTATTTTTAAIASDQCLHMQDMTDTGYEPYHTSYDGHSHLPYSNGLQTMTYGNSATAPDMMDHNATDSSYCWYGPLPYDMNSSFYHMHPHAGYYFASSPGVGSIVPNMIPSTASSPDTIQMIPSVYFPPHTIRLMMQHHNTTNVQMEYTMDEKEDVGNDVDVKPRDATGDDM
ncbi:uncharacterized protein BX664DRAFT_330929 [Halteromyces radiatus]|uniref:uncharacterized protein n=1 Tax=Halteromyces radiatus TaxID=101107 RepID=UPI00222047F8|nr:uncharacterized protein BX664DRAFT_330929 [Halteromyces radiatus]KAI8093901.1 hypothetical protein BX664DRAFT_330929 [Halteromyces radiatus]